MDIIAADGSIFTYYPIVKPQEAHEIHTVDAGAHLDPAEAGQIIANQTFNTAQVLVNDDLDERVEDNKSLQTYANTAQLLVNDDLDERVEDVIAALNYSNTLIDDNFSHIGENLVTVENTYGKGVRRNNEGGIDVTNVSTFRVKFAIRSSEEVLAVTGGAADSAIRTYSQFVKQADT